MADSTFRIKFATNVSQHRRAMAEFTSVTKSAFDTVRKTVVWGGGIGGLGAGLSLGAGIKEMLEMNSATEQTQIAFETFLGSAEKANTVFGNLRQFANVTPYGRDEIVASGGALLNVIKNTDELIPRLTTLGNIASGTSNPINELAQIYAKAMNKGKIQAEELNQLSERRIPIIQTLADIYKVSSAEIMKMGEKGMLSAESLTVAFDKLGGAGGKYFNLMEKQSQSLGGRWSTLKDKLRDILEGSGLESASFISQSLQDMIDELERMKNSGELQEHIKRISTALAESLRIIKELATWIISHRDAFASMGISIATIVMWQKFNMLLNSVSAGMKMLGAIDGGKSFVSLRQSSQTVKMLTANIGNLRKAVGTLRVSLSTLSAVAATAFAGWEIGKALADLIKLDDKIADIMQAMDIIEKNKENSSGAYTEAGFNSWQFAWDMVTFGNTENIATSMGFNEEMLRMAPSKAEQNLLNRRRRWRKNNPEGLSAQQKSSKDKKEVAAQKAEAKRKAEEERKAEQEALRVKAMIGAGEKLDDVERKNKKALEDVRAAMVKIRSEAARDVMSEKIDKWRKNMKQWGEDIDKAQKKLSKLGITLDEPVLKSKEQILQDKKDDLLRRKIAAYNKGGNVSFTSGEMMRIAELEKLRREAAEKKKQSKAAEKSIDSTQDEMTKQERDQASKTRKKEMEDLKKRKARIDAVNKQLSDPEVIEARKKAAAAAAQAQKKQQEAGSGTVSLLRVLEQVKEILKKGLPEETA